MVIILREIDLKRYEIRTDLVDDITKLDGDTYDKNGISINKYEIDDDTSSKIGKKKGKYITISFEDVTDSDNYLNLKNVLKDELTPFFKNIDKILFIGLGNRNSTPDSLGPKVCDDILVTAYLTDFGPLEEGFKNTAIFTPGVTGNNGIETNKLIKSVVSIYNPSLVVLIDALATSSMSRVCKTIQITDTGINPGSGVLNSRGEVSFDTLNVPVLAIGIPTVVDAVSVVSDTLTFLEKKYSFQKKFMQEKKSLFVPSFNINYLKENITDTDTTELLGLVGSLNSYERNQLFYEVLNPIGYNLMVTPKEIDFVIEKLSCLISSSLNEVVHKKLA